MKEGNFDQFANNVEKVDSLFSVVSSEVPDYTLEEHKNILLILGEVNAVYFDDEPVMLYDKYYRAAESIQQELLRDELDEPKARKLKIISILKEQYSKKRAAAAEERDEKSE